MNILIIDDGLLPFDKNSAKAFGKAELLRLEREHRVLNRELARAFAARAQNVLMVSAAEDGAAAPGHFEYSGEGGVLTLAALLFRDTQTFAVFCGRVPRLFADFSSLTQLYFLHLHLFALLPQKKLPKFPVRCS